MLLLAGIVSVLVLGVVLLLADDGSTETATPIEATRSEPASPTDVMVRDFIAAWERGDWSELTALSNDSVAATARAWYVDGFRLEVVGSVSDHGAELLATDPRGGSALIFTAVLDAASGSPMIVDLVFGGDAGGSADTVPPAPTENELTVTQPRPGDLFTSGSVITGQTTSETVEYRLLAGTAILASGTTIATDGTFATTVSFTNPCCTEMTLEVAQPGIGFTTIPLTFPEPG